MSDDFSSNTSTSGTIAIGGSSLGNIERADDQDWFKVHLRGGVIYRFDAVGDGANAIDDTTLRIFDGAGNDTGFFNDDANNSFFAELFFSPRTDGDYFVDVGGFATHTGSYQVSATIDDFSAGPANSGSATVNGGRAQGTINQSNDEDWFAVDLVAGTHYDVRTTGTAVATTLRNSTGRVLAPDVITDFAAPYTGRYYVDVSGSPQPGNASGTGPYTIAVVTSHANGDFNSNGRSDMLWRNANGELAQWSMDGGNVTSGGDVTYNGLQVRPDTSWTIAATTDFNFDGKADMLWRNTSGPIAEWQMNGSVVASSGFVTSQGTVVAPDASWHIVQIGDFNGDAQSDILWRSDSGAMAEWVMNGSQVAASLTPSLANIPVQPDASWQTQAKPTQFI